MFPLTEFPLPGEGGLQPYHQDETWLGNEYSNRLNKTYSRTSSLAGKKKFRAWRRALLCNTEVKENSGTRVAACPIRFETLALFVVKSQSLILGMITTVKVFKMVLLNFRST